MRIKIQESEVKGGILLWKKSPYSFKLFPLNDQGLIP
jgi:hypothetical protein